MTQQSAAPANLSTVWRPRRRPRLDMLWIRIQTIKSLCHKPTHTFPILFKREWHQSSGSSLSLFKSGPLTIDNGLRSSLQCLCYRANYSTFESIIKAVCTNRRLRHPSFTSIKNRIRLITSWWAFYHDIKLVVLRSVAKTMCTNFFFV